MLWMKILPWPWDQPTIDEVNILVRCNEDLQDSRRELEIELQKAIKVIENLKKENGELLLAIERIYTGVSTLANRFMKDRE